MYKHGTAALNLFHILIIFESGMTCILFLTEIVHIYILIEVRSGASEASGAENFTYAETVKNFSTYFCSTDFNATNFVALKFAEAALKFAEDRLNR